ncbi:MAG: TolC family protein [Rikenellaceae bacterium]|jgi:outer membrane protein TolC|nr:TolC family protein [Rikenellaceae bacterium]
MNKTLILCLLLLVGQARGQEYTIERCQELARSNYPNIRQRELIEQSRSYSLENVSRNWLPQLSLSARTTYQTQVTTIPIDKSFDGTLENFGVHIPRFQKDQYQAAVQLNQLIWDGGQIRAARKGIEAEAEVQRQQYEVDAYALRSRVNELFFAVLLLEAQVDLNSVMRSELERCRRDMQTYMDNGVASRSDMELVDVELAGNDQTQIQLATAREAYMRMLMDFVGEPYDTAAQLVIPAPEAAPAVDHAFADRPEMALLDASAARERIRLKSINARNMPQIGLFIQGVYGRPGPDLLKGDKFSKYAIGGVQLSWTFGGLYTRNNERRQIETGIRGVEMQRDILKFNLRQASIRQDSEVEQYRKLLEGDDEIVRLRESIRRATEARVEHGARSASDLMHDMNLEQAARIGRAVHKMQGLKALYDLKTTNNL